MSQEQQATNAEAEVQEHNQLVPVSESIRYRKRAQAAEQQVESLAQQVQQMQTQLSQAQSQLDQVNRDQSLTTALVAAGVKDIEAATLLAKKNLSESDKDVNTTIADLRQQRPWLFDTTTGGPGALAHPTQAARHDPPAGREALHQLAQKARSSGSRQDMQAYLRLRRQMKP